MKSKTGFLQRCLTKVMITFHPNLHQIRYNIFSKGFRQPELQFLTVIRRGVFVHFLNGLKTFIIKEANLIMVIGGVSLSFWNCSSEIKG